MTQVAEESRILKIQGYSQEFFKKIIDSVPLEVIFAEMEFFAEGIAKPGYQNKPDRQRHVRECKNKNIIPYSWIKFINRRSNPPDNLFDIEISSYKYETETDDINKRPDLSLINDLIVGKRTHSIEFDVYKTGYNELKESLLSQLTNSGYHIHFGNLWLTTYSLREYNEGTYADTELLFGEENARIGGLEVRIGRTIEQEDESALRCWFRNLEKDYQK